MMMKLDEAIAEAQELGTRDGNYAGSHYIDDSPSRTWARQVVDDDIAVEVPEIWCSGHDVLLAVGYDPAGGSGDTVLDAYIEAYVSALADAVRLECMTILGVDPETGDYYHPDMIGRVYDRCGIAAEVVGMSGTDDAVVVYVGDDRELTVPVESLTELDDDAYCHECGQVGSCFETVDY